MKTALILLCVLTLLLIAGAFPVAGGAQIVIFRTPVFILVAGALVISILNCIGQHKRWKKVAFTLCHIGVVFLLVGAFVKLMWGEKYEVTIPVTRNHTIKALHLPDGSKRPLGFDLSVVNFSVEFYPPIYTLYSNKESVAEFTINKGDTLQLGEYGVINSSELELTGVLGWRRKYPLSNEAYLESQTLTPKYYEATLEFSVPEGKTEQKILAVNHPINYGGWWFHLQSYDTMGGRYIITSVKRDPGLRLAISGIWMLILGTFGLCFRGGPKQR